MEQGGTFREHYPEQSIPGHRRRDQPELSESGKRADATHHARGSGGRLWPTTDRTRLQADQIPRTG